MSDCKEDVFTTQQDCMEIRPTSCDIHYVDCSNPQVVSLNYENGQKHLKEETNSLENYKTFILKEEPKQEEYEIIDCQQDDEIHGVSDHVREPELQDSVMSDCKEDVFTTQQERNEIIPTACNFQYVDCSNPQGFSLNYEDSKKHLKEEANSLDNYKTFIIKEEPKQEEYEIMDCQQDDESLGVSDNVQEPELQVTSIANTKCQPAEEPPSTSGHVGSTNCRHSVNVNQCGLSTETIQVGPSTYDGISEPSKASPRRSIPDCVSLINRGKWEKFDRFRRQWTIKLETNKTPRNEQEGESVSPGPGILGEVPGKFKSTVYHGGDGNFYYLNRDGVKRCFLRCAVSRMCRGRASMPCDLAARSAHSLLVTQPHNHPPNPNWLAVQDLRNRILRRCEATTTSYRTIYEEECKRYNNEMASENTNRMRGRRQKCSFIGCTNSKMNCPNLHFFQFPITRASISNKWITNCANESLVDLSEAKLKSKVVCQEHFKDDCFLSNMKNRLKKDAVPTIYTGVNSDEKSSVTICDEPQEDETAVADCSAASLQSGSVRAGVDIAAELPFSTISASMYRARRSIFTPVPSTLLEYGEVLEGSQRYGYTLQGEAYYRATLVDKDDSVAVVFVSPTLSARLPIDGSHIHVDETFKVVPSIPPSSQLLTLSAIYLDHAFPVVNVLMARRTEKLYDLVFTYIKETNSDWSPKKITCNYEKVLTNALRRAWPNIKVAGCWGHSVNNMSKTIHSLGHIQFLQQNPAARRIYKMCQSLPLLPAQKIQEGYDYIVTYAQQEGVLQRLAVFLNHVHRVWLTDALRSLEQEAVSTLASLQKDSNTVRPKQPAYIMANRTVDGLTRRFDNGCTVGKFLETASQQLNNLHDFVLNAPDDEDKEDEDVDGDCLSPEDDLPFVPSKRGHGRRRVFVGQSRGRQRGFTECGKDRGGGGNGGVSGVHRCGKSRSNHEGEVNSLNDEDGQKHLKKETNHLGNFETVIIKEELKEEEYETTDCPPGDESLRASDNVQEPDLQVKSVGNAKCVVAEEQAPSISRLLGSTNCGSLVDQYDLTTDTIQEVPGKFKSTVYHVGDGNFYYLNRDGVKRCFLRCAVSKMCRGRASMPCDPAARSARSLLVTQPHIHPPNPNWLAVQDLRNRILRRCEATDTSYRTIYREECKRAGLNVAAELPFRVIMPSMYRARRFTLSPVPNTLLEKGEASAGSQ